MSLSIISHSITIFALYTVTTRAPRNDGKVRPFPRQRMFRECSTRQAFHLYKQKANQINEYGKIDISDKNT